MEKVETRGRPRSEAHDEVSEELLALALDSVGKPVIQVKTAKFKTRNREGSVKLFKAYRVSLSFSELKQALEEQGYRVSLFFATDSTATLRALKK